MIMRTYYVGYDYGISGVEMICGPFGTASEALQERERLVGHGVEDEKLIVVRKPMEVEKVL